MTTTIATPEQARRRSHDRNMLVLAELVEADQSMLDEIDRRVTEDGAFWSEMPRYAVDPELEEDWGGRIKAFGLFSADGSTLDGVLYCGWDIEYDDFEPSDDLVAAAGA